MNKIKLIVIAVLVAGLAACAAPTRNVGLLDARIAEVADGDFGQFLYHESLAEENLEQVRLLRQYAADDHYWNIDRDAEAMAAANRAIQHRQAAEEALIRWHDNCVRHQDLCDQVEKLDLLHTRRLYPAAYFDTGSAVPKSIQEESIADVLSITRKFPHLVLDVIGYTDTVGSAAANKRLAVRRVDAVKDLLKSRGVPGTVKLQGVAIGQAAGPDNTPSQENRRVDIELHHGGRYHHRR